MRLDWKIGLVVGAAMLISGCTPPAPSTTQLRAFPVENLDGVLTRSGVSLDSEVSSDGNGSLRIVAVGDSTVRLYETGDLDVEDALLVYRARVRTEGVEGRVYLEMWCRFPGRGEFFSRALDAPLSGTTDWTRQQTSFFLKGGQNPDEVKLNLVIEGAGTVWIDDIVLESTPLGGA